jgi:alpha-beta hydrolase superfamily lysophospholipase
MGTSTCKRVLPLSAVVAVGIAGVLMTAAPIRQASGAATSQKYPTLHKTITVDGVDIFYREAGPTDAPTILLLHGFPTSSQMFRNLIPALSDRFHLVAPDYPGFGQSAMPPADAFEYTFDRLADVIARFGA